MHTSILVASIYRTIDPVVALCVRMATGNACIIAYALFDASMCTIAAEAHILRTNVVVVAILWNITAVWHGHVYTSVSRCTEIFSATVAIVTRQLLEHTAERRVAVVVCTGIVIVTLNIASDALAVMRITSLLCAFVAVIALHLCILALAIVAVTRIDRAFVVVIARQEFVCTANLR